MSIRHPPAGRTIAIAMALAAVSTATVAQGKRAEKPENVKAMMLAKFAAFLNRTNAPKPGKEQPLRIGIVGTDATAAAAQKALPGRQVDGRTVAIVTVAIDDAKAGRAACDMLYLAADVEPDAVTAIVGAHKSLPMPLICERKGFAAKGGGIQLFLDGDNVRFEVNQEALTAQGIEPAPQFLSLSRRAP